MARVWLWSPLLQVVVHHFASVVLGWQREPGAPTGRVNTLGGAIALGHTVRASGARLTANLLRALDEAGGRHAVQTMCKSGGMANATLIARLQDRAIKPDGQRSPNLPSPTVRP
ncbi:MAG: hypothetical protein JJT95_13205 [Pararhodobacter sp.]|nr:hypothetical protein [Pararhodobacter sp.]